jgi:hypothetical protein
MFSLALLRNWREQRPTIQGDVEYRVGVWESISQGGEPASDLIFLPCFVIVVGLLFKWYTL